MPASTGSCKIGWLSNSDFFVLFEAFVVKKTDGTSRSTQDARTEALNLKDIHHEGHEGSTKLKLRACVYQAESREGVDALDLGDLGN